MGFKNVPHVGVHDSVVLLERRVFDGPEFEDSSVVDQDVETTEFVDRFLDDSLHVLLVGNVGWKKIKIEKVLSSKIWIFN